MNYKILLIEDDPGIVNIISKIFQLENFTLTVAETGKKALSHFYKKNPDLVILDIKLPDISGLEVCRLIRKDQEYDDIPILIISGNISDEDKIEGLSIGADDYIEKPFNMKELIIRVKNALRRAHPPIKEENILKEKDLTINLKSRIAQVKGKYVKLSAKEFNVLTVLVRKSGKVVGRDYLLSKLWGYKPGEGNLTRTLDTHIGRLRKKLGNVGERVKTVKNEGYIYVPDISEIHKTRERLKKNEKLFYTAFSSLNEAVIITDRRGAITFINPMALSITGWKQTEAIGRPLEEVFCLGNEATSRRIDDYFKIVISKGALKSIQEDSIIFARNGRKIPVDISGSVIKDGNGRLMGVVVTFRDMTETRLINYALKESEEELRNILNQSLVGIQVVQDGVFKYSNKKISEVVGYSNQELMKLKTNEFAKFIHPEDREKVMEQARKKQLGEAEGTIQHYHYRIITKNGDTKWVDNYSRTILYGGRPADLVIGVDITDQKLAEEAIIKEQEKCYNYLNIAGSIIVAFNPAQEVSMINDKGCEILGYEKAFIIGKNWFDEFVPGKIREFYREAFNRVISGQGQLEAYYEAVVLARDGSEKIIYAHSSPIKDQDGRITGVLCSGIDITEEKQVKELLKQCENRYYKLFNAASDAIFVYELNTENLLENTRIIEVNDTACIKLGYSRKELLSMSPAGILGTAIEEKGLMKEMLGKGKLVFESDLKTGKGETIPFEISSHMFDLQGKVSVIIIAREITGRRAELQRQQKNRELQMQAEKMLMMETLAGGVAHEFNNIMAIISSYAQISISEELPPGIKKRFDVILNASDRAVDFITNLLAFSEKSDSSREVVDVNRLMNSEILIVRSQLEKQGIGINFEHGELPLALVNPKDIQQVFLQLLINSRDSIIPGEGSIIIQTSAKKNSVEIRIKDTGKGVKKEDLKRIFEPFYTTKAPLGDEKLPGEGLGLSICQGIVRSHNGSIAVESREGSGTTVIIKLPVEHKKIVSAERKKAARKKMTYDILIVDDEKDFCAALTSYFKGKKYRVTQAFTGQEVLKAMKKQGFDMVFLDLLMPDTDSRGLLLKLRNGLPDSRIVILTGEILSNKRIKELNGMGVFAVIQKPFKLSELDDVIGK